jgi:hypothetical protein
MAEPLPPKSSLIMRAQRLFAISLAGPVIIFLTAGVTLTLYGRPNSGVPDILGFCFMAFLASISWSSYWESRYHPGRWKPISLVVNYLNSALFLITMFTIRAGSRFQFDLSTFSVVVAVLVVCTFLAGRLPAGRGERLILDDLSVDVVDSPLTIRFRSRVRFSGVDSVVVTGDAIVVGWRKANGRPEPTYPLADISAVAVGRAKGEREWPIPGVEDGTMPVTPGEVLVVEVPGGKLVFPARDDVARLKQFIEDRRALVLAG